MRMSVHVPRSMMGAIPDAHRIVTDYDGLAMYGDFREVAEPRELLGQLANLSSGSHLQNKGSKQYLRLCEITRLRPSVTAEAAVSSRSSSQILKN